MDGPLTPERVDEALDRMEAELRGVHASQGSIVKLPKAELELLQTLEFLRDFIMACLRSTADRKVFFNIFGGDCKRVSRIEAVLSGLQLSDMNKDDQRLKFCKSACESAEQVLLDLGLGPTLAEAIDREKEIVAKWSKPTQEEESKTSPAIEGLEGTALAEAPVAGEEFAEPASGDAEEDLESVGPPSVGVLPAGPSSESVGLPSGPPSAVFAPPPRRTESPGDEVPAATPLPGGGIQEEEQDDSEDDDADSDACRRYVMLLAAAEQKAVEADREGNTRLALEVWRECAKYLKAAIRVALPKHAEDKPALEEHHQQVLARIAHLEDVVLHGVPVKPIEEHIGEVKLQMGMHEVPASEDMSAAGDGKGNKDDSKKKVIAACAAMGAVGGAVLLAPVGLTLGVLAAGAGAAGGAFAATRENKVGEGARKVGGKAVQASESTAETLKDKADGLGGKMTKTFSDGKHKVMDKSQKLRSDIFEKASGLRKNFGGGNKSSGSSGSKSHH